MIKLFLSYRREDSLDITGRVYDRLAAHFGDGAVFMDLDTIPLGVDFRSYFSGWLAGCDVVLVVIGPQWLEACHTAGARQGMRRLDDPADYVRIEVSAALARGIPVIPVLTGGASMPPVDRLPADLADLPFRNATEVRSGRDFHPHMNRLIHEIERLPQLLAPPPPATTVPVPAPAAAAPAPAVVHEVAAEQSQIERGTKRARRPVLRIWMLRWWRQWTRGGTGERRPVLLITILLLLLNVVLMMGSLVINGPSGLSEPLLGSAMIIGLVVAGLSLKARKRAGVIVGVAPLAVFVGLGLGTSGDMIRPRAITISVIAILAVPWPAYLTVRFALGHRVESRPPLPGQPTAAAGSSGSERKRARPGRWPVLLWMSLLLLLSITLAVAALWIAYDYALWRILLLPTVIFGLVVAGLSLKARKPAGIIFGVSPLAVILAASALESIQGGLTYEQERSLYIPISLVAVLAVSWPAYLTVRFALRGDGDRSRV